MARLTRLVRKDFVSMASGPRISVYTVGGNLLWGPQASDGGCNGIRISGGVAPYDMSQKFGNSGLLGERTCVAQQLQRAAVG